MVHLENEELSVAIHPLGAELQILSRKDNGLSYLWKGDPAFWGKHSPVLFPIVGALRDNTYHFGGKSYTLPRHGFAREKVFAVASATDHEAIFVLQDDESTREVFPFSFIFSIRYRLHGPTLEITYDVENSGTGTMYFSVGGHPAFAVPLVEGTTYDDYYLLFSEPETTGRSLLENGLLREQKVPFLENAQRIDLSFSLFADDAIVLSNLRSRTLTLASDKTAHGLHFQIAGWPDLGIWAAPNAPFVCIEPWQGHADFVHHNQELTGKAGIVTLGAGKEWHRSWSVALF